MVPLNVLAIQVAQIQQQIACIAAQVRHHRNSPQLLMRDADRYLDTASVTLGHASEWIRGAETALRRAAPRPPAPTAVEMTPNEVLRQVEARA